MMKRIESFTYRFVQVSLIFGALLYDYIGNSLGFTYIDEMLMVVLIICTINGGKFNKECRVFLCIFLFYILYSMLFGVACIDAIITDVVIYLKPFVGFYAAILLGMRMNERQKRTVKRMTVLISVAMAIACVVSYNNVISNFMGHPSRLATLYQILGVTYFYCSQRSKKDVLITMLIFGCSMLSLRSKSYAFVGAAVYLFYFFDAKRLGKIKVSTIVSVLICVGLLFIVAWEKFQFYFIEGSNKDLTESFARPALYQGAFLILKDYFPFGSGFGSYACHASNVFYSPLYYKYGLNYVFGLAEGEGSFISDTFFPQLAQFGIVGILFYFLFFRRRYKDSILYFKINSDSQLIKMTLLIFIFFVVESAVDSTFVHNRGMIMMVLLGMIINESRQKTLLPY